MVLLKEIKRESGIELLKIFALFLIVITHVVQTLGTKSLDTSMIYYLSFGAPTVDMTQLIITFLRQVGHIGNDIFFICSAWFLVGRKEFESKKAVILWSDTIFISIIWFLVLTLTGTDVGQELTEKSFFPNLYQNNWYITLYLIFLFIYPILNRAIETLTQKQHFIASVTLFLFGVFAYFYFPSVPFSSYLTVWISLYFGISYLKQYGMRFCDSVLANLFMIVIGILGIIGLMMYQNYIGLKDFSGDSEMLLKWNSLSSPFVIMTSLGLFNVFRQIRFKSRFINYISSVSLFVYLIHENILVRIYYRPRIWAEIARRFDLYDHYVKWIFIYSGALLIASIILGIIYKETLKRIFTFIVGKVYDFLRWLLGKGISIIVK